MISSVRHQLPVGQDSKQNNKLTMTAAVVVEMYEISIRGIWPKNLKQNITEETNGVLYVTVTIQRLWYSRDYKNTLR